MEDVKLLKRMRLFRNLTQMELIQIGKVITNKKYAAGETIIREGAPGGSIYFIKKGELEVSRSSGRTTKEISTFKSGDHFGEISFIDGAARSATIRASEDSELLEMTHQAFEKVLKYDQKLQVKLLTSLLLDLCEKLRKTNDVLVLTEDV